MFIPYNLSGLRSGSMPCVRVIQPISCGIAKRVSLIFTVMDIGHKGFRHLPGFPTIRRRIRHDKTTNRHSLENPVMQSKTKYIIVNVDTRTLVKPQHFFPVVKAIHWLGIRRQSDHASQFSPRNSILLETDSIKRATISRSMQREYS